MIGGGVVTFAGPVGAGNDGAGGRAPLQGASSVTLISPRSTAPSAAITGKRFLRVSSPHVDAIAAASMAATAPTAPATFSPYHARLGETKHVGGRWRSKFNDQEQQVGVLRRRLENIERMGA